MEELADRALVERAKAGDSQALNLLFNRHWRFLGRWAARACGDPAAAEDVLQEACAKVAGNLARLPIGADFRRWTCGFVLNEIRGWRKKLKKVGTPSPREDIYILENMTVEPHNGSEEDRLTMLSSLAESIESMAPPAGAAAAHMLQHLVAYEELPSVRSLATSAHLSQGAAQRAREEVLDSWRRTLAPELL